jgi:integrase/recombinase XerD
MSTLRDSLADYLAVRRSLGFSLERQGKLLAQLVERLDDLGQEHLTVAHALEFATLPAGAEASWWSDRLSVVRGFARHLHALDPAHQVPPVDLLPSRSCRATPYIYSDAEIAALIEAARTLRFAQRTATYQTLIALLAVTGMRIGEAIALDREDLDLEHGLIVVRAGKFGKSRQLPLDPSTIGALRRFLRRKDRPQSAGARPALFVSATGTRLAYCNVQRTFHGLTRRAGLGPRSATCRPRLHDLRHTFAVRTVIDAYREGADVQARLSLLSTYLGHVDPKSTYWYLSAAPELLQLAAERLERHLTSRR